jgi:cysteine synthase A
MRWGTALLDRQVGGSTGTNLWGAVQLIAEMVAAGERGSVVTLICDDGRRYAHTYYDDDWVADRGWDLSPYAAALNSFRQTGTFTHP